MKCIVLTQKDKLINHAIEQQPNESCAMLLGEKIDDSWNVKEIFLTENIDKSQTNFTTDSYTHLTLPTTPNV